MSEEETSQDSQDTNESKPSEEQDENMKIFLIVLFVVTLIIILGYFLFYSSIVSPTQEVQSVQPQVQPQIQPQIQPQTVIVPQNPTVITPQVPVIQPTIPIPQAIIGSTQRIPTISVVQSPDATSDLQSVLNYLYQRGTDTSGVPWSPEVLSTLANSNNWQIQTTSPQSWLYPAGITTNSSYYIYFDDLTVSWQIRPLTTTIGQAVGGTYQTIPPNLYQPPVIRFA